MSAPTEVCPASLSDYPLPALEGANDKEDRGAVLVVGGGARAPGAPILSGLAALRAGAGKLRLAATPGAGQALGLAVPEAGVFVTEADPAGELTAVPSRQLLDAAATAGALVVGPGLSDETAAPALAAALIRAAAADAGVVLDAAAMAAALPRGPANRLVLTPHAGEMAKLSGRSKAEVEADPLELARGLAARIRTTVVMKGAETFIVSPDGRAWRHSGGVIGLATSGSGDVLAGVIGGLLARGAAPAVASIWGVCLHAAAGQALSDSVGPVGFLARELLAQIPRALAAAGR